MNYKEKLDRLDGIFANDKGRNGGAIKDESFKDSLRGDTDGETGGLLTHLARGYLNNGYTLEDINVLIKWSEHELGIYF